MPTAPFLYLNVVGCRGTEAAHSLPSNFFWGVKTLRTVHAIIAKTRKDTPPCGWDQCAFFNRGYCVAGNMSMRTAAIVAAAVLCTTETSGQTLTCAPPEAQDRDLALLGQGRCTNTAGNFPTSFACLSTECPDMFDVETCGLVCESFGPCTGFELRLPANAPNTTSPECWVITATTPPVGSYVFPWVQVNGTQPATSSGVVVAATDHSPSACCYKKAYPRPNPLDNPVPIPVAQSDAQKQIFANRTALAEAASNAALPNLTALIDFCANYTTDGTHLFDAVKCPGLADLTQNGTLAPWPTTAQILERFDAEVRAAEYGHGFFTLTKNTTTRNVFNPSYEFLINLWEPSLLGVPLSVADPSPLGVSSEDIIQTEIFGCAPFTGPAGSPLNFYEAADRVVYSAMNYERTPLGNTPGFGLFTAVLRPKYVEDKILFTPTDSGKYYTQIPNCTVWPNCVAGTVQYYNHILLSWMALYGAPTYPPEHAGGNCASQMDYIRKMVCELPPPTVTPYPPATTTCNSEGTFWEADILGSVRYPEGVKFIVASFSDYFGNVTGSDLRTWCINHKWALVWVNFQSGACKDPRRMVDPVVLPSTTLNVTLSPTYVSAFSTLWTQASANWAASRINLANMTQWDTLVNESLTPGAGDALLWSSSAHDCVDYDNCIGVTHSKGTCACYAAAE